MDLRLIGTVCDGCPHIHFGEVPDLRGANFTSWQCKHFGVLIGNNAEAGQKPFPKKCKERGRR